MNFLSVKPNLLIFLILFIHNINCLYTDSERDTPLWNFTHLDRLRNDILLNYDKFARPTQHYNTTNVSIKLVIRHVEIQEITSRMTVHAWTSLEWVDEKLKWNASEYGGITVLNLADHEIWRPDIFLFNSALTKPLNFFNKVPFAVSNEGEVLWVPPTQHIVHCEMNLKHWPMDTQVCQLIFGSWTYNGQEINLIVDDKKDNQRIYEDLSIHNSEWEIDKYSFSKIVFHLACCPEPYHQAVFELTLSRHSAFYKCTIVTPLVVIILITLMGFWLPRQSGQKISLNLIMSLILIMYLLFFNLALPALKYNIPLIVKFFSSSLFVVCNSLFSSVIAIWISRTPHTIALPWILKKPLKGVLKKVLFLECYVAPETHSREIEAEEFQDHQLTEINLSRQESQILLVLKKSENMQQDWILFAVAIDRISFILYSFIFIILSIEYAI